MPILSFPHAPRRPRAPRRALGAALALAGGVVLAGGTGQPAQAACPWIVQPALHSPLPDSEPPLYDIVFDGPGYGEHRFYGFTVASLDLFFELAGKGRLPDLHPDGRKLAPMTGEAGITSYQIAPDTIRPHTIYLVAAKAEIDELERIGARIEPAAPIAVSQLLPRIRGASDLSGPLPQRSVPGIEIAAAVEPAAGGAPARIAEADEQTTTRLADLQICAYQVALR